VLKILGYLVRENDINQWKSSMLRAARGSPAFGKWQEMWFDGN